MKALKSALLGVALVAVAAAAQAQNEQFIPVLSYRVGPYAAAHIMMLLGRYSRLVLDSWTRPKYASLNGGRLVKDATIERRFRRDGPYAGLAFWLVLTRDWIADA